MGPRNGVTPDQCAIVVRLKPQQYRQIAAVAARDDRSMASVVRQVFGWYFGEAEAAASLTEPS